MKATTNSTIVDELVAFRRELHAHPELSNHETRTSGRVVDFLSKIGRIEVVKSVGKTGVLGVIDSGVPGPTIAIRADMDALPIEEVGEVPHRSTVNGVGHMCGHDGHTTILLGLAQRLIEDPISRGKVILVFQPAEENGTGARAILAEDNIHLKNVDVIYALHNIPGEPEGAILVKEGHFTAHVNTLIVHLKGKTAHASEPEHGINPSLAMAEVAQLCEDFKVADTEVEDFYLITPVYMQLGSHDYGISADTGDMRFTNRAWSTEIFNRKSAELMEGIQQIAEKHGLKVQFDWVDEFFSNNNDPQAVKMITAAAKDLELPLHIKHRPFKWGEDFGLFTQKYPGAMFGLGAGKHVSALHNPDYDFNDKLIPLGVNMFHKIITHTLNAY